MWWEYLFVGSAVLLSLLWLVRHFSNTTRRSCGGCTRPPPGSRLQKDIPVIRNTR